MPTGGQEDLLPHLFRDIQRDFEALVRLIQGTIEQLAVDGAGTGSIERLTRAKEAAELGAALARRGSSNPTQND